ncbi:glucosaminidase domain-containing protein [Enterococcus sp. 669A]|uniref:Glucosaminidase domain-containing protein n=1 Tax=Candidatus Enterococcus moelleringii TaxID=2815325 RepID=A0ABS3L7Y9_9ENTE|nr:glucosaminidase domain-containing protein [Enterococcus sp. 669A]MBO1305744.1 glucosaminidase domain-containing protein [Enterococcus sp. 669A]
MKGKALLLVGCLLLTGCQAQVKQSVSAETKESLAVQQESVESQPSVSSEATPPSEASSQPIEQSSVQESSIKEEVGSTVESTEVSPETAVSSSAGETTEESKPAEAPAEAVKQVISPPITAEKVEENYQFSVVKNQTTEEFIQAIGKDAQQIAWDEGLYASVMIAQAILETGSGNSQLARPPHHNLFGIKGSYQGKQVNFNTREDKGNGQLYTINSSFRQYPSYKESLEDYAALLKNGLSGNPGFYQATWKESAATYQDATKALTGKYATDTSYDKKLNALIETYELTRYDQETEPEVTEESSVASEPKQESSEQPASSETTESSIEETGKSRVYETRVPVQQIADFAQRQARNVKGTETVK